MYNGYRFALLKIKQLHQFQAMILGLMIAANHFQICCWGLMIAANHF